MPDHADRLIFDGREFELVILRGPVAIYRGDNCYLRIGPVDLVRPELKTHKRLLGLGFPVPGIIAAGVRGERFYYIEASAGLTTFGDLFDRETRIHNTIQQSSFEAFLSVIESFAEAQLRNATSGDARDAFARLLDVERVMAVLPELADRTRRAFALVSERLQHYPTVITHGDFHAFNICERGVIDFEAVTEAPAGYDLVSAVLLPELFPPDPQDYVFSRINAKNYLERIDRIFISHDLAAPTRYLAEFRLCKLLWLVARRERPPRLMGWMGERYREMLEQYLVEDGVG